LGPVNANRRWRWLARWLFAFAVLAAVISLVVGIGDVEEFTALLERGRPVWLLAALYVVVTTTALLVLWFRHAINPMLDALAIILAVVALAVPATMIWARRRLQHPLPAILENRPSLALLRKVLSQAPAEIAGKGRVIVPAAIAQIGIFLLDAGNCGQCCVPSVTHRSSPWRSSPSWWLRSRARCRRCRSPSALSNPVASPRWESLGSESSRR
jgi:hypothetical protein